MWATKRSRRPPCIGKSYGSCTAPYERKFLTSEVAGRTTVLSVMQKIDPRIEKHSPETGKVIEKLKELEYQGYQFEGADGAFDFY